MATLEDRKYEILVHELKAFEAIAASLQAEVGNETTVELQERLKNLKAALTLPEWE